MQLYYSSAAVIRNLQHRCAIIPALSIVNKTGYLQPIFLPSIQNQEQKFRSQLLSNYFPDNILQILESFSMNNE